RRIPAWSGDRAGVEQDQVVDDAPVLGPGFASAGDIQDAYEQFLAQVLDAGFAGGDPAGVDVHQVVPAARQVRTRGHLDHGDFGQAVGCAPPGGEAVDVHACGQLQRAPDEDAGRGGGVHQPRVPCALARRLDAADRCAAGLDDRTHGLFDDVRQAAALVARRGVCAAVSLSALQVIVVPGHLAD